MARKFVDNASTTLNGSITNSATSITVTDGSKFGTIAAGDYITGTIDDNAGNIEIIHITARSSNVLTVLRGQEGTSGKAFASGITIEGRLTAQAMNNRKGALASLYATLPGTYVTFTGKTRWYPRSNVTLVNIEVSSGTAVAGTNSTFNVRKNNTAIFTSPVPTISIGNTTSTPLAMTTTLTSSDYLTIDCTAAGGSDAVVRIDYEPTE